MVTQASSLPTKERSVSIDAKPAPISVDLERTGVLVIDMQNDFGAKDGMLDKAGVDLSPIVQAIGPTQRVLRAARKAGLPVIYLKMGFHADLSDAGPPNSPNRLKHDLFGVGTEVRAPDGSKSRVLVRDTWGTDIIPELAPERGDEVLYKARYSGFYNTKLDEILRRKGIEYLLVTGCTTSVCVESTIRDAMFRDYSCLLLADCTGEPIGLEFSRTNHDASLLLIEALFGWVSDSQSLLDALDGAETRVARDG